jgi:hypothetical protein
MICILENKEKIKSDNSCLDCPRQMYQNCEIMRIEIGKTNPKKQSAKIEVVAKEVLTEKLDDLAKEIIELRKKIAVSVLRIGEILNKLKNVLSEKEFKEFVEKINMNFTNALAYIRIYNFFPEYLHKKLDEYSLTKLQILITFSDKNNILKLIDNNIVVEIEKHKKINNKLIQYKQKKKFNELSSGEIYQLKNMIENKKIQTDIPSVKTDFKEILKSPFFVISNFFKAFDDIQASILEMNDDDFELLKKNLIKNEEIIKPIIKVIYDFYK